MMEEGLSVESLYEESSDIGIIGAGVTDIIRGPTFGAHIELNAQ